MNIIDQNNLLFAIKNLRALGLNPDRATAG